MKPTQSPLANTDVDVVSQNRASVPGNSRSKFFFTYHSVEFVMRIEDGNEAAKVECTGMGHLVENVMQCPYHEHLMCRKCCFPLDEVFPFICPKHETPLFYDKLAGRSIRSQEVTCPANETFNAACPWKGQYNEVTMHLDDCTFIPSSARVTMQNSMLKAADQRAEQKYEKLEEVTASRIEGIRRESERRYNALELLSNQRYLELMQKFNEMADRLKNLSLQQTSQPAVFNPPAETSPELVATPPELVATPPELVATLPALAATTVEEDNLPAFFDSTLTWKISGFSLKLELAKTNPAHDYLFSPAFYTSRRGYKMRAKLYPFGFGTGKGTHISIFFQIMEGPYDEMLIWPFRNKVTFMIWDPNRTEHMIDAFRPDPKSCSYWRPRGKPNFPSGFPTFLSLESLDNHGYLRDDTLYVQVIIEIDQQAPDLKF